MPFVEQNFISKTFIIQCIYFLDQYLCTLLRLTTVIKDNLLTYLSKAPTTCSHQATTHHHHCQHHPHQPPPHAEPTLQPQCPLPKATSRSAIEQYSPSSPKTKMHQSTALARPINHKQHPPPPPPNPNQTRSTHGYTHQPPDPACKPSPSQLHGLLQEPISQDPHFIGSPPPLQTSTRTQPHPKQFPS